MKNHKHFMIIFSVFLTGFISIPISNAITQFYFTVPYDLEDTNGLILSVDIDNKNFSWIDNGNRIMPHNNNTPNTQADDTGMDLDANEYLLAIDNNIDPGTRVYMCIFTPLYMKYSLCQTDAIDKDNLAYANFDNLYTK